MLSGAFNSVMTPCLVFVKALYEIGDIEHRVMMSIPGRNMFHRDIPTPSFNDFMPPSRIFSSIAGLLALREF
jgi:hypothetical protein